MNTAPSHFGIGSHCSPDGLHLADYVDEAALNLWSSSWLCPLNAGMAGLCHYGKLMSIYSCCLD